MTPLRCCPNPAVVKQMRRHASTVKLLMEHAAPVATERWLCEEHADVVDEDWIEVAKVTDRAPRCEWEDDAFGEGGAS